MMDKMNGMCHHHTVQDTEVQDFMTLIKSPSWKMKLAGWKNF
jgi:hypothetical protein